MTKGDLMTLIYGENYSNVDSALPQPWVDKVTNELELLGLEFDISLHCMDYNKARHGKVVNLAEELVRSGKLKELLDELKQLRYEKEDTTEPETGMLTMVRGIEGLTTRIEIIGMNRKCTYLGDLAVIYHNGKTVHGLGKYHLGVLQKVAAKYGVQLPLSDVEYKKWFKMRPRDVAGYPIK